MQRCMPIALKNVSVVSSNTLYDCIRQEGEATTDNNVIKSSKSEVLRAVATPSVQRQKHAPPWAV